MACLTFVSAASPIGSTLLDAAEAGDRATALRLLAGGADPNALSADGASPLMWAAHHDDLMLVQALIKAGANVKLMNQFGSSAITEAAIIGSAPVIDALLKAGANPNTKNPDGETPLMAVARSGKIDAARLLLDAKADVNSKESWGGQSALMWAAAQSQAEMVKFLASRGADVDARGKVNQWERKIINENAGRPKDLNKGGFTPLLYAAREGCVECARNLLAAKADPDIQDPDGSTPLTLALMNQHFNLAAVLIKGGADLDRWDLYGRSPLYMAADVSILPVKGNGAMVAIPSDDSLTAVDIAKMLLEAGANPNIQLKRRPPYRDVPQDRGGDGILAQGATPLLRAARAGDAKFVEVLLKYKALVDLPSKEGVTPLMAAAGVEFGQRVTRGRNRTEDSILATMKLLIEAGADINAKSLSDTGGGAGARGGGGRRTSQVPSANAVPNQTAMHGAASHGFNSFVEFLAKNGADLQARDATGRTPMDLARGGGGGRGAAESYPDTVKLIQTLIAAKTASQAAPK
jgi:ankyrin repeat protein